MSVRTVSRSVMATLPDEDSPDGDPAGPSNVAADPASTALDRIRVRHLALWAVFALFGAVGLLIASGLEVGPDISERMLGMGVIGGTMVGWLGQALWGQGLDLSALFGPLPSSPSAWGTVLVGVLAVDLLNSAEFHLLVPWLEQVAPGLADRYVMNAVEAPTGTREYLRLIGSGVIAVSLVEEVLFRGVVYQRWAYAWNRPVLALGAAAVPFALLHGHVLGAFVFAGVTTLLYVHTRSLWAPIAMHVAGNASALLGGCRWRPASNSSRAGRAMASSGAFPWLPRASFSPSSSGAVAGRSTSRSRTSSTSALQGGRRRPRSRSVRKTAVGVLWCLRRALLQRLGAT